MLMEPFFRLGCNLAVALFLFCSACGQASPADPSQKPASSNPAASSNLEQVTNQIRGTVVDWVGAVVPGATVLFRSKVAGACDFSNASAELATVTNQFGEFSGTLRPGIYQVWVQGFHDCVEVAVTTTTAGHVTLKISPELEDVDHHCQRAAFRRLPVRRH